MEPINTIQSTPSPVQDTILFHVKVLCKLKMNLFLCQGQSYANSKYSMDLNLVSKAKIFFF